MITLNARLLIKGLALLALLLPMRVFAALSDAQQKEAASILNEMMSAARAPDVAGQVERIEALKQRLAAMPKPARGDRAAARKANDAGLESLRREEFPQAVTQFKQAHAADPSDIEVAGNLGMACNRAGDRACALKYLGYALTFSPERTSSWIPLAETLAQADRAETAGGAYGLAYLFSANKDKTRAFIENLAQGPDPKVATAASAALRLPLIAGVAPAESEGGFEALLGGEPTPAPAGTIATTPAASPAPVPPPATPAKSLALDTRPTQAAAGGASTSPPPSGGAGDVVQIVASGMGTDAEAALRNAYSNAIQQALGMYVDAETLVQNDQIIKDQVLTHSRGLIKEVKTLDQSTENGLYTVRVQAKVERQPLMEKVKPMLKSTARIDGTSLHAGVATEQRQKQDAAALFAEAIKPMIGPGLFDFEFDGEPVLDEKNPSLLLVTVKIKPNLDKYRVAEQHLLDVLKQIAVSKSEVSYVKDKNQGISLKRLGVKQEIRLRDIHGIASKQIPPMPGNSDKASLVTVKTWTSPNGSQSKWKVFSIPSKCDFKPAKGQVEVSIFDAKDNLVALGSQPLEKLAWNKHEINVQAIKADRDLCSFSPDILVRKQILVPEAVIQFQIAVEPGMLALMKRASIEVKLQEKP